MFTGLHATQWTSQHNLEAYRVFCACKGKDAFFAGWWCSVSTPKTYAIIWFPCPFIVYFTLLWFRCNALRKAEMSRNYWAEVSSIRIVWQNQGTESNKVRSHHSAFIFGKTSRPTIEIRHDHTRSDFPECWWGWGFQRISIFIAVWQ